ncbi:CaiB/BaiF CoA transferase family protein [Trujillonella humicola]|uniref:CaiB/BaiF CoA transferase family protein n=1 Tax=Trujillonella humicola TaxID=3383699 RepID=UPI003905E43F
MTLPLAGTKVLEFSEHGFVPSAAAALADLGAEVVKIERLEGDAMRQIVRSGLVATVDGYDFMFELVNRNKRGIALAVQTPEGRQVFERLVRWADVYITNQLPRVRRKLRTEPDDLFALNPRLVVARGHGQGQRGPDAEAGGFDGVSYWARGGVSHVLTDETAQQPTQQRPALGDIPSGMFLAGGICAALVHVLRTGKGTVVDTSLLGAAAWTLGPDLGYSSMSGTQMPAARATDRSPLTRQYRTADGRWLTLMMLDEARYWAQACRALGLDDLVDELADPGARRAAWEVVDARIRTTVAALDRDEAERRLRAEGCIFAVLAAPTEVLHDPAVEANGYLMAHPEHPTLRLAAPPVQFDDTLPAVRRPGPRVGEHSVEVLGELGYGPEAIEELVAAGTVGTPAGRPAAQPPS